MLILTRKLGESINIGDDVEITLLDIRGKQVRLGIKAPSDTVIHRKEVYERIKEENILAAGYSVSDLEMPTKILEKVFRRKKEKKV